VKMLLKHHEKVWLAKETRFVSLNIVSLFLRIVDEAEKDHVTELIPPALNDYGCDNCPPIFSFKSNQSSNYFHNHAHKCNSPSYLVSRTISRSIHDTGTIN
jgi:hypothetical protein